MPELPEVETLRRGLAERLVGRTIAAVEVRLPKLFVQGDPTTLVGKQVAAIRRVAKFLIWEFADDWSLVLHLNLTGQIILQLPDGTRFAGGHPIPEFTVPLPHKTTRLLLTLDDGSWLALDDVRTFARAWLLPRPAAEAFLAAQRRGPDALLDPLDPATLSQQLRRHKRAPIKAVLLDQAFLAGVGNIYADEALFGAGIHPARPAGDLSEAEVVRLLAEVRAVVQLAVQEGVARVRNGRAVPGAQLPRVHARRGEPCPRCRQPIVKTVVAQRGTYFCPACQPLEAVSPNSTTAIR